MNKFISGTIFLFIFLLFIACSDTPPEVVISDINCKRDDISITATATASQVSPPPGSQHSVVVKVNIKCNGVAVNGAKISVEYWWGTVVEETTDTDGNKEFPPVVASGAIPPNSKVTVTLKPDQGDNFEKEVDVTTN